MPDFIDSLHTYHQVQPMEKGNQTWTHVIVIISCALALISFIVCCFLLMHVGARNICSEYVASICSVKPTTTTTPDDAVNAEVMECHWRVEEQRSASSDDDTVINGTVGPATNSLTYHLRTLMERPQVATKP